MRDICPKIIGIKIPIDGRILRHPDKPNLAILALGAVKDRPVVHEGAIAVRKMIYFSLTFDHRVIDGAEAARFVNTLGRIVSRPGLLLAGV